MLVGFLLVLTGSWMGSALPILGDPPAYRAERSDAFDIKIPIFPGFVVGTVTAATEPATESVATPSQSISNEDIAALYDSSSDALDTSQFILSLMVRQTV